MLFAHRYLDPCELYSTRTCRGLQYVRLRLKTKYQLVGEYRFEVSLLLTHAHDTAVLLTSRVRRPDTIKRRLSAGQDEEACREETCRRDMEFKQHQADHAAVFLCSACFSVLTTAARRGLHCGIYTAPLLDRRGTARVGAGVLQTSMNRVPVVLSPSCVGCGGWRFPSQLREMLLPCIPVSVSTQ